MTLKRPSTCSHPGTDPPPTPPRRGAEQRTPGRSSPLGRGWGWVPRSRSRTYFRPRSFSRLTEEITAVGCFVFFGKSVGNHRVRIFQEAANVSPFPVERERAGVRVRVTTHVCANAAFWTSSNSRTPVLPSASKSASSFSLNVASSPVPCSSMNWPAEFITRLKSTSAPLSSV